MHAITTKYLCPTNTRGSRIIAKAAAGSLTVGYDHALNLEDNHKAAAQAFVDKKGWSHCGDLVTGQAHNGEYVHVFAA